MKLFGLASAALIALFVMAAGAIDGRAGSAVLVVCALLATGINVLRGVDGSRRRPIARRQGLGFFGVGTLILTSIGAAIGTATWKSNEAVAVARQEAAETALSVLVANAPSISPMLDQAQMELTAGKLEEAGATISRATAALAPLRGHESRAELIGQLEVRLEVLSGQLNEAIESRLVAAASGASKLTGAVGLEAMLSSRDALRARPRLSSPGADALSALELALTAEAHKLGALGQPAVVLQARLFADPPVKGAEGYLFTLQPSTKGLAIAQGGRLTSLYMVAASRPGGLSEGVAQSFVELVAGPVKESGRWQAPAGNGARSVVRTHGAVAIHEGWSGANLVELWAGDFNP